MREYSAEFVDARWKRSSALRKLANLSRSSYWERRTTILAIIASKYLKSGCFVVDNRVQKDERSVSKH